MPQKIVTISSIEPLHEKIVDYFLGMPIDAAVALSKEYDMNVSDGQMNDDIYIPEENLTRLLLSLPK